MCRLKIKVRIIGKKNQPFIRFILIPKNIRQRGKYLMTLGYWDVRQNKKIRYIVLNTYKLMYYYYFGATWTKTTLHYIYNFFVNYQKLNNSVYFNYFQLKLLVQDEIKNKYK